MNRLKTIHPYWHLLATYLRPQRGRVLTLTVLVIGGIGLQLANPQIVAYFIDTASENTAVPGTPAYTAGLRKLFIAAAIFMGIAIIRQIVNVAAVYIGEHVAWTATNALRADLALHCLQLDMTFHKQHKPGELIERVDGDVNQLANFFSQLIIQLGSNLLLLIGVIVLLYIADWRIGLAMTAVLLLATIILNFLRQRTTPRWQKLRQADANLFGSLEEWLSGVETIRSSGATATIMGKLYRHCRDRWLAMRSAMRANVWVMNTPTFTFALAYSCAHLFGASLYRDGIMTIGGLYLIFYYIDLIKDPVWRINRQIEDLQRAGASLNRIVDLRNEQPTLSDGRGTPIAAGPLSVQFNHVSFNYADDPHTRILDDVDFSLQPGAILGLLGRTGSGKSTLTKLLFRFYDPTEGVICLNGRDLRDATQAKIRQHIGLVTQEVQLFHASLRDNLTMFDDTIPDEKITAILNDLGLGEWANGLLFGLDTQISGNHVLSAGEAQLLAFARVFLADPGLVILDEASARLDPATEQLIERAIDELLNNRTAVIVAHRLGTVQRADEIMVLGNGRILEHNTRQILANDSGSHFYQLLQTGLEEEIGD
ncbi:MAG: ABC transporter ATP-binding protein [Chloroflexi bacterium]|nr:ABC transporter ATP-binding protein [Chloroflexota bacterium]